MNSNSWLQWWRWEIVAAPGRGNGTFRLIPQNWMNAEVCRTLSFVLLHSLWQGALLGAVLWVCLRCIRAQNTFVRYALSSLFLLGLMMCTAVTGAILNLPPRDQPEVTVVTQNRNDDVSLRTAMTSADQLRTISTSDLKPAINTETATATVFPVETAAESEARIGWTRWVAWGWLLGASIMVLRIGRSLLQTRRLVQESSGLPTEFVASFQGLVEELQRKLRLGRQIRIACSDWINVPAVCGTVWPVLLMPTAMLTGIPLELWRLILAHELAHIRRHDYFVNVLQMLIESVFFFNPAVWWISRQMRIEREACCDALAVEVTGQPLAVARALVNVADWVRRGNGQTPRTLVAWQSIDGNQAPGELTERVKRIAQPGMAPRIHLPWYSLLTILAMCSILLLGLQQGAQVAVQAAVQMLSPEERVEKLIEVEQKMAQEAAAANGITEDPTGKNPPQAQSAKLSGVMKTADGLPVPVGATVRTAEFRKHWTGNSSNAHVTKSELRFPFEATFHPPCQVFLIGQADGYASAIVGPISLKPGQSVDPVEIVFDRGTSATIRLIDSQKKPIAGAKVSASLRVEAGGGSVSSKGFPETVSDAQGLVKFEGAQSKFPYQFKFTAPNFQEAQESLLLLANQTIDVELQQARPTQGQLIAAETGAPVAGAELLLVAAIRDISPNHKLSDGPGDPREGWTTSATVMARTEVEGHYTLNTLTDNVRYQIYVRSQDFRPAVLSDVMAGELPRVTRLQPPLILKGKVLGARNLPMKNDGTDETRMIDYKNVLRTGENGVSYNDILRAPVRVKGDVGNFELRDLFPGRVTLILGTREQEIPLEKSIEGLVIDLNLAPASPKTRKVIFQLSGLPEYNPVSGKLKLTWRTGDSDFLEHYVVVRKEGRAEADLPIGVAVAVWGEALIGCWMKTQSMPPISEGTEPFEFNLSAIPAGAIQGRVLNSDGTPCETFDVHVIVAKTPASMKDDPFLKVEQRGEVPGKFLFQQLPFGGEYQILVRSRDRMSAAALLSEPVAINAEEPLKSLHLRLLEGEKLVVRVLDEAQRPTAKVMVHLKLPTKGDRVSRDFIISRETDAHGLAFFKHLNPELLRDVQLTIEPSVTRTGQTIPLDPETRELDIKLERGLTASGQLVDVETGKPIPNRTFRIAPRNFGKPGYLSLIRGKTDEQGKFVFQNLEAREYQFYIDGADLITEGAESPTLTGGSETPVRIEARLRESK
jgi:beta-lactamase regulating signal transducer with metallopeptidase domain